MPQRRPNLATGPSSCCRNKHFRAFEELAHHDVVHLWRAVEHHALLGQGLCRRPFTAHIPPSVEPVASRRALARSLVVSVLPVPAGPPSSAPEPSDKRELRSITRRTGWDTCWCATEAERLGTHQGDVAPLGMPLLRCALGTISELGFPHMSVKGVMTRRMELPRYS